VRALNVWLALSRCGDESPGMDIVPKRLDRIVPTGTEGAIFEWSVSPNEAEAAAGETGVVRPIFEPGDVLLFDDLFLHTTAADPSMKKSRMAIESWFFGASASPTEYAPLAV
jgi:ectoine hydroxylase-related dioxygenase (phytanoyl-CoA dioxygenase family)